MNGMKTFLNCSVALMMVLGLSTLALARGTADVSNTQHNLSISGPSFMYSTTETEVCIFCHTPHGGSLSGPLWNRTAPAPASGFTFYSSSTMNAATAITGLNNESLLCLSCHDGSIATNQLLDGTLIDSPLEIKIVGTGTPGARIGGDMADTNDVGKLADDHPISFSYQAVYGNYVTAGKPGLHDPASVPADIRLFGDATERFIECSTCHDPHVDYSLAGQTDLAPFLNMSNAGSAMCLACHDK